MLAAWASDPEVTRYLAWAPHEHVESLEEFFRACEAAWRSGTGHHAWLLFHRGEEAPIGSIGLDRDGGKVSYGYALARPAWGRGLATEALRHLVEWALAQDGIERAWAFCDADNEASARVLEKAGLEYEGRLRRWHVCPTIGPGLRDAFVHAKVR